ncbi:MAG: hypothetical protein HUJ86_03610 [Synergistes sp.]|nr:hypothetical protein [Synergistes sp.]
MRVIKSRQEAGCEVTVITTDPDYSLCGDAGYGYFLISQMQNAGINVLTKEESDEHFALIDDELVWYGSVNLLGKKDSGDNMMRVKSAKAAEELLALTLAYL